MRRLFIFAFGFTIALGASAVLSEGPALAHEETCTTDSFTGSVECVHDEHTDGSDPTESSFDEEARWNAYGCNKTLDYQVGYEVVLTTQSQIPAEDFDFYNSDTSAPGYRFLEEGQDYYWVLVHCEYPGAPPGGTLRILSGAELIPGVDPLTLRAEALAKVVLPELDVATSPPHDTPGRFGVVRIPTWFWMEPSNFDPVTEEASDPGGIMTVSVTATPLHAFWDPDDGEAPVQCFNEGVEWVPGLSEDASDCKYAYPRTSTDQPDDKYTVGVEMVWEYTWAIDGVSQDPFGGTTTSTSFPFAVGEIQAVGT